MVKEWPCTCLPDAVREAFGMGLCDGCRRNLAEQPCQRNPTGDHSDPDNSGQCIYCGAILDEA
jgi:hypothetical protein